ncbi:MAG: beta strand repeat-containing protein, partial [Arcobacter sp.]|uniref:beta strand repeat-containing protein n=1 Tax=Arcobacter sp. TaxID=1872629 RepID=UPI003D0257A9
SVLGNNGTNTLSLGSVSVVATDIDGDIATGTVNVEVIDDVPTITVSGGTTIAEDAVDNVATIDVNESIVTGTWDNANAGADEAASTVVVIGTTEYALGTAIDTGKGTLTVNTNGTWTFDPVTGLDQDTVQSVTFSVKVTDNDGDVASDDHTITITDGTGPSIDPTANSITLTTDEADMATDDTDTLTFTLGSDALESIAFGTDLTALVSDTNEVVGTDVVWTRTSDTVITGTIGGQTAITLTLTPNLTAGTASVKADIADNFDSVLGNNGTNTLSLGSVSVVATDIDGDIATGTVNVEVIDDVPTVNFTDAINNTTTPTIAIGTWSETIGADNNSMTLGADVELNWVKVNNVLIPTTTFTFDNSSNTGSGTFVYDGTTYNFDLTLNNNGTYEVVAASLPQTIEINYNEFSSSIKASGPTDTYIVEYQDADTKDIYIAKIYAELEGNSLSLVNYVNSTTTNIIPSTTVGSTINVSATGIGLGNNVLESYYKNGVYTSESLYFNPDNETNLITLNFTGTGANAFGSGDVIYIELTGVDGTVQTILLDSVHGDFIVNSDNSLTPISNTYTGGNLSSYSVSLSNGEAIDYVKVTTGFSGTTETNVKLAFSYSVSETVTFNEDLSMNFTATITDADNDQDSIDFDVQFNKVDLIPESTDKVFDMTLGDTKETVNVVITLDLSGSMDDDINDTTRLALAKDAIENMLNAYADNYIVNVKLVTFSDSGTSYDWILNDVDTAIDTVNSLNTGLYTNYEAGVSATYSNYTEPTADKTVAYFISDGAPTSENNEGSDVWFDVGTDSESGWLDTSYKTAWNTFVDTYVDELNVIAVNSGTFSTTYLDALASAEQGNTTIVITDEYQLSNILVNLASEQISGNAYSTISGGNGVISIDAIEVNGTTYNASDYTSSNNTVTLNNWNGTLTFNFSNGAYTYVTSADKFTQDLEKSFKIFASDADGDTTSFDVKINVDIDDTASTPTLDMNISDSTTVISDLTYPDRTISNGATYSQTISLGSAYANKTVTVSFDAQTGGNWNNSDTFKVYNGTISSANEVYSNKNDFTVNNKTFTVTLDSFGNATINFVSYSNESDETIRISDFKVLNSVESYHYTIALDAGLTDNGETLSDITLDNLPAGTTIDGLTANVDGSYTIDINSSGDATVTLISPTQLDPSSLNSITASVTSTETTGDEAVITVTDTSILSVEAGSGDDEIDYTGATSVDGGDGIDTFILDNSDSINLSNVTRVENIDMTAQGAQSASLSLSDVINMDLETSTITSNTGNPNDNLTGHILKITGDNSDTVNLSDTTGWTQSQTTFTASDNVSYDVYTNDTDQTYKVLIQTDIDTNI